LLIQFLLLLQDPTKVTYSHSGKVHWEDFLPSAIIIMCGNPKFVVAATCDHTLYFYTHGGRRLLFKFIFCSFFKILCIILKNYAMHANRVDCIVYGKY
jgi:hypothetical protein